MPDDDLGEHRVGVIEPRRVDEVDEDLRVAGVAAAGGNADGAAAMREEADLVAHERPLAACTRWRRGCRPG